MPCRDGSYEIGSHDACSKQISSLEEMLCSACRSLEKVDFDFGVNPMLDKWWAKHKKEDEAREALEIKRSLERAKAKEIAETKPVSKLNEQERTMLKNFGFI